MSTDELLNLSPVDSVTERVLGGQTHHSACEESTDFVTASDNESDVIAKASSRNVSCSTQDSDTAEESLTSKGLLSEEDGRRTPTSVIYRVYGQRWFMLMTIFLLNVSNGMMWLTYAPIPNYTAAFYGVSVAQVDWLSLSYFITSLLFGFIAIAIIDTWGLKVALYLGAMFNVTGSALRWLSTAKPIVCSQTFPLSGFCSQTFPLSGFLVAMIGQVLTACSQPFLLYSPTKLAAVWFGAKERAFCTMLASLGNPIGLAVAQLVSPSIVTAVNDLPLLMLVCTVPAIVLTITTFLAFWHKAPPIPPAPSADKVNIPFFKGLKTVLTNLSFWILLIIWGCGAGLFNALLTLMAQILCPFGYSDRDSGLWGALMIFSGLVGATIAGVIVDYTKKYKEIAVVTLSLALLCLIWFTEVSSIPGQGINIAFSLCFFGFFALPLIPVCMELGVEITYPVAEATSSGLLWSAVQVMGFIFVLVSQAVQQGAATDYNMCVIDPISANSTTGLCDLFPPENSSATLVDPPKDLSISLLIYTTIGVLMLVLLVTGFRPKLKRLEVEERAKMLIKLQQDNHSASVSTLSVAMETESLEPDQIRLGDTSRLQLFQARTLSEHNTNL